VIAMPIHDWTRVNAGTFHHFHHEWISSISHVLNSGLLPNNYYAMAEQIAGGLHPDVLTLGHGNPTAEQIGGNGSPDSTRSSGVALATAPPKVRMVAEAEEEQYAAKSKMVTVRHVSGDQVVAIVEIVSSGNKSSHHGLRAFVEKTIDFLHAGIHLLVLDLFPPGPRDPQGIHGAIWSEVTAVPFQLPEDKPLTLVAYMARPVKTAYIEPMAVGDVLTEMPLFVEPQRYVSVPLEATYQSAFAEVPRRWREELEPPTT
jgi:hypothetical protein